VRNPPATTCSAVMFGTICVGADHETPQSVEVNQLMPLDSIGTTTRPQTLPPGAPGGGGWTSGTPPMPAWALARLTGGDHVRPPSVDRCILMRSPSALLSYSS